MQENFNLNNKEPFLKTSRKVVGRLNKPHGGYNVNPKIINFLKQNKMKTKIERLLRTIKEPLIIRLLLPALLLLFSFAHGDKERSKAKVIRKEVIIGSSFQNIIINGNIWVILTNKPAGTISIEGNNRDVNTIRYKSKNNELVIDATRKKRVGQITIYVSATMLKHMLINGDGQISSTGIIKSDELNIWLNGIVNVDINIIGRVSVDTYDGYDLFWNSTLNRITK